MGVKKGKLCLSTPEKLTLTHGPLKGFLGPPGGWGWVPGPHLETTGLNYTFLEGRDHRLGFLSPFPWDLVKYSLP